MKSPFLIYLKNKTSLNFEYKSDISTVNIYKIDYRSILDRLALYRRLHFETVSTKFSLGRKLIHL